jgi:hypothetical protein
LTTGRRALNASPKNLIKSEMSAMAAQDNTRASRDYQRHFVPARLNTGGAVTGRYPGLKHGSTLKRSFEQVQVRFAGGPEMHRDPHSNQSLLRNPSPRTSRSYWVTLGLILLICLPIPAYAYGDPTGGAIFQILGPILALAWGAWMIFANGVRRRVSNLIHKMRGTKPSPTPEP